MQIYINEQGIQALKKLADHLKEQVQIITQETNALQREFDSDRNWPGPYAAPIHSIIDETKAEIQRASSPVNELAEKLYALAKAYRELLDASL